MGDVYIGGVGMIPFGKSELSLEDMAKEAVRGALCDAGIGPDAIDSLYVGIMSPEEFTAQGNIAAAAANWLDLQGKSAYRIETASSSGAAAFMQAYFPVASGFHKTVLIVAMEKMSGWPTAVATKILSEVIDSRERKIGATMPALAALVTQHYMQKYRVSTHQMQKILFRIVKKNRANGIHNPYAQFRKDITEEDYRSSRMISSPLRLFDCSAMSDGAVALVLTSEPSKVKVIGLGQGTDTLAIHYRSLSTFRASQIAAKAAYSMARVNPSDVDLAELHDAFSPFELITAEQIGFLDAGRGGNAILDGETDLSGRIPINPSGGLLARGHPIGASGLAQIAELVFQLREEVEPERQVRDPLIGLAHSIGGLSNNNLVTILQRADRQRVVPVDWSCSYQPEIEPFDGRPDGQGMRVGRVAAVTTLHVPPEGHESPIQIGLIRDAEDRVLLARARTPNTHLKVGSKTSLTKRRDVTYFHKRSPMRMLYVLGKRKLHWRRAKQVLAKVRRREADSEEPKNDREIP